MPTLLWKFARGAVETAVIVTGAAVVAGGILLATSPVFACGAGVCSAGLEGLAGEHMSGGSSWENALGTYRLNQLYSITKSASGRARLNRNGFGPYTGNIRNYDVPKGYDHVTIGHSYTRFHYPPKGKAGSLSIQAIDLGGCGRTCSE